MQIVLTLIGLLMLVGGVLGIIAPKLLLQVAEKVLEMRYGILLAASGRILVGLLLILAASHTPVKSLLLVPVESLLLVLGGILIGFGIVLPVIGRKRLQEIVQNTLENTAIAAPVSLLSAGVGSFLIFINSFSS